MAKKSKKQAVAVVVDATPIRTIADTLEATIKDAGYPDSVYVVLERTVNTLRKASDRIITLADRKAKKLNRDKSAAERKAKRRASLEKQLKSIKDKLEKEGVKI